MTNTNEAATPNILTPLRIVRISAQPAITTSEGYFKEAGVVSMGANFKSQFLGLTEFEVEATDLVVRKLTAILLDDLILTELGGRVLAEISVSQFRAFLAENRGSPEWFIFYLTGRDENLWTVRADWRDGDGGWFVYAFPVDELSETDGWSAGDQVVSCH